MDWIKKSNSIESLDVEICFQLQDSFYIGDPNNHKQLQDERYSEVLDLPSFDRIVETMARTSEVVQNVDGLVKYYRDIIERADALNIKFNDIRQYFWLRLWFWNAEEGARISFPWYDSLSEMQQFFEWLKGDSTGQPYVDMDQGWQLEIIRSGDYLHIRQFDPDGGDEYDNISIPFEAFVNAVSKVEARAIEIISSLSADIGVDVWTKYLGDAKFGTSQWNPDKKIRLAKSKKIIIWLLVSFLAFGFIEGFFPSKEKSIFLWHGCVVAFLVLWWIGVHSKENEVVPAKGSKIITLLMAPIGLPYYFYKSYGFRKGSMLVLYTLFTYVLAVGLYAFSNVLATQI